MFRWLQRRREDAAYRDAVLTEIADYLHDASETLERIEAHAFAIVNAVEAVRQ